MTTDAPRLVIVGGGPAGAMAASEAAGWGMHVTVVDEQEALGGQYFRVRPGSHDQGGPWYLRRTAPSVQVRSGASVVDAPEPGVLSAWEPDRGITELRYDALVLATGAYDRPVPIPGWTLPGVLTAGGANMLARVHHVAPGKRVIVAGAGPFLYDVAQALRSHGCRVTVVEPSPRAAVIRALPVLLRAPDIVVQAAGHLVRQTLRRWTVRHGEIVTAIHGGKRVDAVSVARVDGDWRPVPGSERRLPADAVCLGFGFVPHLDLSQLLGCALDYDPSVAGFSVATDDCMRTSVPRVYAAGESAGVAGLRVARLRGRLAGLTAASDAGLVPSARFAGRHRALRSGLARCSGLAAWIAITYRPRPALWDLAAGDTVVCRCEDVLLGEIERALEVTQATPVAVKAMTRAGMGPCQGRFCSPFLVEWLRTHRGFKVPAGTRPWSVRPPLRPVPLGDWLAPQDPAEEQD